MCGSLGTDAELWSKQVLIVVYFEPRHMQSFEINLKVIVLDICQSVSLHVTRVRWSYTWRLQMHGMLLVTLSLYVTVRDNSEGATVLHSIKCPTWSVPTRRLYTILHRWGDTKLYQIVNTVVCLVRPSDSTRVYQRTFLYYFTRGPSLFAWVASWQRHALLGERAVGIML